MDNRERAEKIVKRIWKEEQINVSCVGWIAAQIEEACAEAVDALIEKQVLCIGDDPLSKKIYEKGFTACREQARDIVLKDHYCYDHCLWGIISARIAALRPVQGNQ